MLKYTTQEIIEKFKLIRVAAMSSTAMHHAIKLQLKFIGCIAYRCGYAQVFIN